ncbi:MAG TPA: hypothetical protein VF121_09310 [Thermoanaerobaculia bacterium]|nr:hypothetical protein [Thermoanaerobaculia bacterium]
MPPGMRDGLAWLLQLLALVVVGSALLVGLVYDQVRLEVGLLGVGGVIFLLGRWLQARAQP